MAPESTLLVQSVVEEGDEVFSALYWHLWMLYPGYYAPATDHPVLPTVWAPRRRESQHR